MAHALGVDGFLPSGYRRSLRRLGIGRIEAKEGTRLLRIAAGQPIVPLELRG